MGWKHSAIQASKNKTSAQQPNEISPCGITTVRNRKDVQDKIKTVRLVSGMGANDVEWESSVLKGIHVDAENKR